MKFRLGQRVATHGVLQRTGKGPVQSQHGHATGDRREWVRPRMLGMRVTPREGVIVGRRTLQNGWTEWGGYEEPSIWHQESTVPAYLVAYDLHTKAVPVHADDIEPLEGEQ